MSRRVWWEVALCGTDAAYSRHVKAGEPRDQACREAHALAESLRREEAAGRLERARILRKAHARVKQLKRDGEPVPLSLLRLERAYQREAARRKRERASRARRESLHSVIETARQERRQAA